MRVRQIKWSGGSNCHCAILYLPEGKLCSRTSRILFLRYFALQFIPLLRLLVSSSHFLFITTRFLRCWCLASWSLDPILFLLLLLFFWMKPQLSASYSNIVRGAVVYICITASALALGIYCCLVESVRSLLWFDLYGNQQ